MIGLFRVRRRVQRSTSSPLLRASGIMRKPHSSHACPHFGHPHICIHAAPLHATRCDSAFVVSLLPAHALTLLSVYKHRPFRKHCICGCSSISGYGRQALAVLFVCLELGFGNALIRRPHPARGMCGAVTEGPPVAQSGDKPQA